MSIIRNILRRSTPGLWRCHRIDLGNSSGRDPSVEMAEISAWENPSLDLPAGLVWELMRGDGKRKHMVAHGSWSEGFSTSRLNTSRKQSDKLAELSFLFYGSVYSFRSFEGFLTRNYFGPGVGAYPAKIREFFRRRRRLQNIGVNIMRMFGI